MNNELFNELVTTCGEDRTLSDPNKAEKLSKDFYWYSPVLKPLLESKKADYIVLPATLEELKACVSACYRHNAPITIRGGGTGNYGQCVPLYRGVVIDLTKFNRILSLENGVARVEPGARLGTIEPAARKLGYELRCMPSTWVKSTMGGFFCGGSGGIGSIKWGGINAGDNIKSVTILSVEESPRLIRLEGEDSLQAVHTYGTNCIMVEIEMRLAPKIDYQQMIFCHEDWETLFEWSNDFANNARFAKRLVTQFENPIPSYFKPLRRYLADGDHATFILVEQDQADELRGLSEKSGLTLAYDQPLKDPLRPPYITDYTWNHTTLWAIKEDPSITYLQSGFGENYRQKMRQLWDRFPGEILMHLEWVTGNSKMKGGVHRPDEEDGSARVGGIPLVRFKSEERLQEILDYCAEIDVFIANPHTFYLEEGGSHPDIEAKRALKADMDPRGLLNPGKMKTYDFNPFERALNT